MEKLKDVTILINADILLFLRGINYSPNVSFFFRVEIL